MTWVKACGLGSLGDVETAQEAGADAIGLNLIDDSPRVISVDTATTLARWTEVPSIVLVADRSVDEVLSLLAEIGAHGCQPYGEHAPAVAAAVVAAGGMALVPERVRGPVDLTRFPHGSIPLLDGYSPDALGGTGTAVSREWLPKGDSKFVLAGGLAPENVAEAVRTIGPWGVDASSGLESSPGTKDPDRIRAFIEQAKAA